MTSGTVSRQLIDTVRGDRESLLQLLLALCKEDTLSRIINRPVYPAIRRTDDLQHRIALFHDSLSDNCANAYSALGNLHDVSISEKERKTQGQYFTPDILAEKAIEKLRPMENEIILDAGSGTGIFAIYLLKASLTNSLDARNLTYVGIENSHLLALATALSLDFAGAPSSWKVLYGNFLRLRGKDLAPLGISSVSALVCNPPFVRFHTIGDKQRLMKFMERNSGLSFSMLSGLHGFFLGQAMALAPKARMVFLLPSEMNGVRYGSSLLEQLNERYEILVEELPVTSGTRDERLAVHPHLMLYYFLPRKEIHQKRLPDRQSRATIPLGFLLNVKRGISTGANGFFLLDEESAKSIPLKYLRKIVTPRIRLPNLVFTDSDWKRNSSAGEPCWVLLIGRSTNWNELPVSIKKYIANGERAGVHQTATCRSRSPWYSIGSLSTPPDIVFTYMSRIKEGTNGPRFICNESRAFILNNLLGLWAKSGIPARHGEMIRITQVLNECLSRWTTEQQVGRKYAGGLIKFEPGDLKAMPVPKDLVYRHFPSLEPFVSIEHKT